MVQESSEHEARSKQGKRSRSKGSRGERGVRDWLVDLGFTGCRRTQQRRGDGTSDVEAAELSNLHIECKLWSTFNRRMLLAAFQQAQRDSEGKPYCVVWRCTHQGPDYKQWRLSWRVGNKLCTAVDKSTCFITLLHLNGLTNVKES